MGSETNVKQPNETAQQVAELLMANTMTIEQVSKYLEKHPRSVYRALESIKRCGYQVIRMGDHGNYQYAVRQETA